MHWQDTTNEPLLQRIARTFAEHLREAVMVGNAAAALHGAPVTTPEYRLHVSQARATSVSFGEHELRDASLTDIIKSKHAAGRSRDLAVLEILEKTLHEQDNVEN